MTGRF